MNVKQGLLPRLRASEDATFVDAMGRSVSLDIVSSVTGRIVFTGCNRIDDFEAL
jgi:hypothetical protein